jgi:NAD(P)-dependent dehydrogenase (short-subunit alcohol dehydrogenase family)
MELEGKTALVTGGSSGIGLATAKLFVERGARVAITGRDQKKLELAKSSLGDAAIALRADVASVAELADARDEVSAGFGSLDILFANAGVAFGTPIGTTDEAAYHRLMDVNVKGVFFTIQAMLPLMGDGGVIILNTSWLNQVGRPGTSLLSASKAAVRSFARTLSAELLPRRIRVNCVSPGAIRTPIHQGPGATPEDTEAAAQKLGAAIPLGRMGNPEDIAHAALFLASDASAYMLGAEIVVDGGFAEL